MGSAAELAGRADAAAVGGRSPEHGDFVETDSLYIELSREPCVETKEVADGVNLGFDARGNLVGFDIDRAANRLDLASLETTARPLRSYRIG